MIDGQAAITDISLKDLVDIGHGLASVVVSKTVKTARPLHHVKDGSEPADQRSPAIMTIHDAQKEHVHASAKLGIGENHQAPEVGTVHTGALGQDGEHLLATADDVVACFAYRD